MLSISCLSMNNVSIDSYAEEPYHCTIESFMEGYVKVKTGSLYEKIALSVTYGHVHEYDIYVHTNGKDVGMKSYLAIPRNNYAEFIISETADLEEAWDTIRPILKKYSFYYSEYINKKIRSVDLEKSDNQSIEDFVNETESLMIELKNTGYVSQFYPPGSLNDVTWISGNFEFLGVSGSKRETLLNYINENLPNYSLSDEGWLIPDDSLTLQERFDVVQKIYDDIGIGPAFGTVDIAYDYVGNGINLLEDIEPTDPTEPTGTTEPTETTEAIKTTSATTTTPVETTTSTTATMPVTNPVRPVGDIDGDNKITVRDCAYIASKLAKGEKLSDIADYNKDGKVNVRDAAAIARDLAKGKI